MNTGSSPRTWARTAGLLYMIVILASTYALYAGGGLVVRGDASATAANILNAEPTFRAAHAANLVAGAAYVAVIAILYGLLKPVSRTYSMIAALMGTMGCAVGAASSLNVLAPLVYLGDASYLAAFSGAEREAMAMNALRLNSIGSAASLVFFGFYCLLLARLVAGASFVPRIFALLLGVSGVAWVVGNLAILAAPAFASAFSPYIVPVAAAGEALFTLWLLVIGINTERWYAQRTANAGHAL